MRIILDRNMSTKLFVLMGAILMPLLLLLYFFIQSKNAQAAFTEKEIMGVEYLQSHKTNTRPANT